VPMQSTLVAKFVFIDDFGGQTEEEHNWYSKGLKHRKLCALMILPTVHTFQWELSAAPWKSVDSLFLPQGFIGASLVPVLLLTVMVPYHYKQTRLH
jgi:hypothetical protein